MGRGQIEDRSPQDGGRSPQAHALFDAQPIYGLEGEDEFEDFGDVAGKRLDLGQPASKIDAQDARRSLVFLLEERRAPSLRHRRSQIGREGGEDLHAAVDQQIDALIEGPLLDIVDEERFDFALQLRVHRREERFHVGKMSEDRADTDVGPLGDLLRGRREEALSDQLEHGLDDGAPTALRSLNASIGR